MSTVRYVNVYEDTTSHRVYDSLEEANAAAAEGRVEVLAIHVELRAAFWLGACKAFFAGDPA